MNLVPVTASVFTVRLKRGLLIPVVVVDRPDGQPIAVPEIAEYFRRMAIEGHTLSKMRSEATTLALLHDHLSIVGNGNPLSPGELPDAISQFLRDRRSGTESTDGRLKWPPVKIETVARDRHVLRKFSDFCASRFGHFPIIPDTVFEFRQDGPDFPELIHRLSSKADKRLLGHLAPKAAPKRAGVGLSERAQGRSGARTRVLTRQQVEDMIHSTKSDIQKMLFIQGAFGGQRVSEMLHTWRCDVLPGSLRPSLFPDDDKSDLPLVIVAHPSQSRYTGTADRTKDRLQYLAERRLRPRNMDEGSPFHLGWKGMSYDNHDLLISQVYWSDRTWALEYLRLFRKVRDGIIPAAGIVGSSHPYLFVNDRTEGDEFGSPMKMPNALKAFRRATARLHLPEGCGCGGIHSLRHFYKSTLENAGLTPDQIRAAMHHRSVASQSGYARAASILNTRLAMLSAVEEK